MTDTNDPEPEPRRTMRDVDHTPPREGANETWERGATRADDAGEGGVPAENE